MVSWGTRDRFRPANEPPGVDAIYGSVNVSKFTRVRCPSCDTIYEVPVGQFDAVHNCTIMCPYDSTQMQLIPCPPSTASVRLLPQSADDMMERFSDYFYYCPNGSCPFLVENGYAFMQKRVQTEFLIGR